MLEFITEEISGMLAAHSEAVPFRIYWVDARAWAYCIQQWVARRKEEFFYNHTGNNA